MSPVPLTPRQSSFKKDAARSFVAERAEGTIHLTPAEQDPKACHEATAALAESK